MRKSVASIGPDATALEAAEAMRDRKIGALLVLTDGKIVGIVSERDLVYRVVAPEHSPTETRVGEIMTANPQTASPGDKLEATLARMQAGRFRHMPVVEANELVGIVSQGDLVKARLKGQEDDITFLTEYIYSG